MPAAGVQLGTPSERFSIALRSTSASPRLRSDRTRCADEWPLRAKSCPSLTIIIYVRNIFGLATKESSHPSMMATSRATTSAVPPTADIVGQRGHVRKVPLPEVARLFDHVVGAGKQRRRHLEPSQKR